MSMLESIKEATINGNANQVVELAQQAVDQGINPETIINDSLIVAMGIVGERFKNGEIYVPEMLIAARAMQSGLKVLKPLLVSGEVKSVAKVVMGTVRGDLHDIGKNLVSMMLEGAGMEVVDLGVDVPPDRFVEAIKTHQPQFVGMSALLTTTMENMKTTIAAIEAAGLRDSVKILVGGAPVSRSYADEIGADGYAPDAGSAVDRVKELMA